MSERQFQISSESFWYNIEEYVKDNHTGGIYKLYCLDDSQNRIGINRLLKTDNDGILYIGKATNFLDRVINLKKSLSPDHISSAHECGARYKALKLNDNFPYHNLWVNLTICEYIDKQEKIELNEYEKMFGELPPLNRNK